MVRSRNREREGGRRRRCSGVGNERRRRELVRAATLSSARLPAARLHELQRELAGLTHGEGAIETTFGGYEPLASEPPTRERTMPNPLKLEEYLMVIAKRIAF